MKKKLMAALKMVKEQLESGRLQWNQKNSLLDEMHKCRVSYMTQLNSLKKEQLKRNKEKLKSVHLQWQHEKTSPLGVMEKYRATVSMWLNLSSR